MMGSGDRDPQGAQQWPSGVMGATLVLGTSVERRESSNLSLVTARWFALHSMSARIEELGSAKLEYRIAAIAGHCKCSPSGPAVRVRLLQQKINVIVVDFTSSFDIYNKQNYYETKRNYFK